MTTTWASTDHDPLSCYQLPTVHPAAISTSLALAIAREDIHHAAGADEDRRHQHALSARDNAVTVLLDPTSPRSEREYAEYYLAAAEAIIAATAPTE
jgi:hypothetical protein